MTVQKPTRESWSVVIPAQTLGFFFLVKTLKAEYIWFQRTQFWGSWLWWGWRELTSAFSFRVSQFKMSEGETRITSSWKDLHWRLQFPLLSLLHILCSLKSTFECSFLEWTVSALHNSESSQFCSLLWRLFLCIGLLGIDPAGGVMNPSRRVIVFKFWHFRKMFNMWRCWSKYVFFFFPYSHVFTKGLPGVFFFNFVCIKGVFKTILQLPWPRF